MTFSTFLLDIAIILIFAKAFGEIMNRLRLPSVVGELLAGVVLGYSVLNWIDPKVEVLYLLAEMGAVLLLFEIGLEMNMRELLKAGLLSVWVGTLGVVFPFLLGWLISSLFKYSLLESLFMGGVLTATSVGITARVLRDFGWLRSREANIIMGAAVLDDVLALLLLTLLVEMKEGRASLSYVAGSLLTAMLFLGITLSLGWRVTPFMMRFLGNLRARGGLYGGVIVFLVLLSLLAEEVGLAPIVGAFAAGLLLSQTEGVLHIRRDIVPLADFLTPFFFVIMGAQMQVGMMDPSSFLLGFCLLMVAFLGKILPGVFLPTKEKLRRWIVGVGMVPRGEVGLVFASLALGAGIFPPALYAVAVLVVMLVTLISPVILQILCARAETL